MPLFHLLQLASTILFVFIWLGVQFTLYAIWFLNLRTAKDRLAKAAGAGGLLVSFISVGVDPLGDFAQMYEKDPGLTTVLIYVYAAFMAAMVIIVVVNVFRYLLGRIAQRVHSGDAKL